MTSAGVPPRSRRILRLIALERIARGVLLLAAGVYLLFHPNSDFGRLGERVMRAIELDPRRPFLHRIVVYLHDLHAFRRRRLGQPPALVEFGEVAEEGAELVEAFRA